MLDQRNSRSLNLERCNIQSAEETQDMSANVVETAVTQQRLEKFADRVRTIRASLHEVVVGQDEVIDQLLVCRPDRLARPAGGRAGPGQDAHGQGPGLGLPLEVLRASSSRPT